MKEKKESKIATLVVAIAMLIFVVVMAVAMIQHKCEEVIIDTTPQEPENYQKEIINQKEQIYMLSDSMMDSVDMDCGE